MPVSVKQQRDSQRTHHSRNSKRRRAHAPQMQSQRVHFMRKTCAGPVSPLGRDGDCSFHHSPSFCSFAISFIASTRNAARSQLAEDRVLQFLHSPPQNSRTDLEMQKDFRMQKKPQVCRRISVQKCEINSAGNQSPIQPRTSTRRESERESTSCGGRDESGGIIRIRRALEKGSTRRFE